MLKKPLKVGHVYAKSVGIDYDKEVFFYVAEDISTNYRNWYRAVYVNPDKKSIHDCGGGIWSSWDWAETRCTFGLCDGNYRLATKEEALEFASKIRNKKIVMKIRDNLL